MAMVQILTAAIPDPTVLVQDQLAGAIRGVHIHLDDPSVCITQAQIICVYSGKLGQSSPRRCRKRPPHVHFKEAVAEWKQVCLVRSQAQGGPDRVEEVRRDPRRPVCVWLKRESVHVCLCRVKTGHLNSPFNLKSVIMWSCIKMFSRCVTDTVFCRVTLAYLSRDKSSGKHNSW